MKIRNLFAILLVCLLCLTPLASCDSPSGDTSDTSESTGNTNESTSSPEGNTPDDLTVVENSASQYRIIVSDKDADVLSPVAYELIDKIEAATGATLSATTDFEHPLIPESTPTDYEILIGTTREQKYFTLNIPEMSDLDYYITVVGTRIVILGGSSAATIRGVNHFIQNYLPTEETDTWTLSPSLDVLKTYDRSGLLTAMSLNLLHGYTSYTNKLIYGTEDYVNEAANTVEKRRERVRSILLTYLPDVVGMQEVSNWHSFLESDSALTEAGYKLMRCPKNQKISIYYNSKTLTALDSGSIYLTEDPENLACSVEWKSDGNPRLAHFVRFKINATGETFVAVNTHIGFENATLQINQTRVVGEYCQQLADKYGDAVICTGDFNSSYGSDHYEKFISLGLMDDTRFLATESSTGTGSFNGFGSSKLKDYAIDQVMVSKKDWTVYTYKVDYTMFGNHLYYSDHYAVVSTMILTPKE